MRMRALPLLVVLTGCPAPEEALDCEELPVLTWENYGEGFMRSYCQPCHASGAQDRHDAPDQVSFDDLDEVLAQLDRIEARATGEAPTMPPGGGGA